MNASGAIVIVTGGRDYQDRHAVHDALSRVAPSVVLEGGAKGADTLGGTWAAHAGLPRMRVPARWQDHGAAAGPRRNAVMLNIGQALAEGLGRPLVVVAFPGGKGTADCVTQALARGIEVREVDR